MQGTSKRGILCFKPALRLEEQGNQRYQRTIVADVTEGFDTHRSGRPLAGWMSSSRRVFGVPLLVGLSREKLNMKTRDLRRAAILFFPLLLASQSASAATAAGSSALALASLVAAASPLLNRHEKRVMARLFAGHSNFAFPANRKISIKADAIVCRASNVAITSHSCKLTFGAASTDLTGREAHELYATLAEAGLPSEGAAGSIYASLSHLVCTIDPREIAHRSGGGADCTFDSGAP